MLLYCAGDPCVREGTFKNLCCPLQDGRCFEQRHNRNGRVVQHLTYEFVGLPEVLGSLGHADDDALDVPLDSAPSCHIADKPEHVRDRAAGLKTTSFLTQLERDNQPWKLLQQKVEVGKPGVLSAAAAFVGCGQVVELAAQQRDSTSVADRHVPETLNPPTQRRPGSPNLVARNHADIFSDLRQQANLNEVEKPVARQVKAPVSFFGADSGVAVFVATDPRAQSHSVTTPPQT